MQSFSELDLGSRKSLDDHHPAATIGTATKWAGLGCWAGNAAEASQELIDGQSHLDHRLDHTRMRPPQSGLVQVGFGEVRTRPGDSCVEPTRFRSYYLHVWTLPIVVEEGDPGGNSSPCLSDDVGWNPPYNMKPQRPRSPRIRCDPILLKRHPHRVA